MYSSVEKKILCPPIPQVSPMGVPRYDTSLIPASKRLSLWNCKGNCGCRNEFGVQI